MPVKSDRPLSALQVGLFYKLANFLSSYIVLLWFSLEVVVKQSCPFPYSVLNFY